MLRSIVVALFLLARSASSTSVVAASSQLRKGTNAGASFISTLKFSTTLRICNAYPYSYPMDVFLGKEKLTETAMPYKACGEFHPDIKAGDKLDFKVRDSSAGSFSVSELPQNDAILVLVIYRHDTLSTAVSFESHVFASLLNAQLAILDAYKGPAQAIPRIQDKKPSALAGEKKEERRSEELRFDSVVAVNQGLYDVILTSPAGEQKTSHQLVALNRESYLVVRCGVQAVEGQSYPEELMVFPESDPAALSGAAKSSLFAAVLATIFSVCMSA